MTRAVRGGWAAVLALAACAPQHYLGTEVPAPCTARDVENCLGWMVERDLADAALDVYADTGLHAYVQRIAARLAVGSRLARVPRVVIVDRDGTYATSGSRIVVARTTIERLASEAELAAVVAHELAHIEGQHAVVSLYGPPPEVDARSRRDIEAVADERAVALLERAGYAPSAMARALRAIVEREDDDHPRRADRVARVAVLAGSRPGFEGRGELLAQVEHMVVGRDARLGRRVGDAWVIAALDLALDLAPGDIVRTSDDVLVLRRARSALAIYAIGAPWARELVAALDDRGTAQRRLGRFTVGTVASARVGDDAPLDKLARAVRATLPQPAPGTRVAVLERPRGALVMELGGDLGDDALPALGFRPATPAELTAAEPARLVIERALRSGPADRALVCEGRLLDDPRLRVAVGDPLKCADRELEEPAGFDVVDDTAPPSGSAASPGEAGLVDDER